ncbi:MAG: CoA-binding protein [Polyangiaceae bacterium]|nr:CoA-binding protein [Polyangiaceae bacterium]
MSSSYQRFFEQQTYAVVGHTASKPFPILTYRGLKRRGKQVFAIDPDAKRIDDDPVVPDLASLPQPVDGVVIEVPRTETLPWVEQVVAAGVKHLWLHMSADTPEAIELARKNGIEVRHGTCAVQYLDDGFPHNVHKLIRRVLGRY